MNNGKFKHYAFDVASVSNHEQKVELATRGFIDLFPFARASLFSYSALTNIGEGVLRVEKQEVFSMREIREDARSIQPIYSSIKTNRAEYVAEADKDHLFPERYIEQFQLESLVVVPVIRNLLVIGVIIADQYEGSGPISEKLLNGLENFGRLMGETIGDHEWKFPSSSLSNREVEVLEKMSHGQSIKEMAKQMGISEFTARDYISTAMRKMGVQHRAHAVAEAIRQGIIR